MPPHPLAHPLLPRRQVLQAGAVGLLGLGVNHLTALAEAAAPDRREPPARSVIFIFLSGGLSQIDSFDPKPDAPAEMRGEFRPIATRTPGVQICEHLPKLATRGDKWALVRSLTHPYNAHSAGHAAILTGTTRLPEGFSDNKPQASDPPAIAAVATQVLPPRNNLPPAVVLPEVLIHNTGRVIPGQFAGQMGGRWEPWFLPMSPYNPKTYGAYPLYGFHHERGAENPPQLVFQAPSLELPADVARARLDGRLALLAQVDRQRRGLEAAAEAENFDRHRRQAVALLADPAVRQAFDVTHADAPTLDRYGRHQFGWSLLLARRLVEAGVRLVQVNLGNNETWDTHVAVFPNLKNFLLPPLDQSVSALLDDLAERGLLESTLVVMAGEFGRTPRIFSLQGQARPGRDHWGRVQTVWLAGGGVRGGAVVGSSDRSGGAPATDPQTPEDFAATIYQALGLPRESAWRDPAGRPHFLYTGRPIAGVMG
jgi:uncharacterized protein (DUF1501 family)